jgi:hypothetical protein
MSKVKFFKNWGGSAITPRITNKWVQAEGSSLSADEWEMLKNCQIVLHRKPDKLFTKIFALDEQKKLWSVVVNNQNLAKLQDELMKIGFTVAA